MILDIFSYFFFYISLPELNEFLPAKQMQKCNTLWTSIVLTNDAIFTLISKTFKPPSIALNQQRVRLSQPNFLPVRNCRGEV